MNKQTRQMIERAYERLDRLNNIKMTAYRDKLHGMNERDEKRHRRGNPHGYKVPAALTAKFFTVRDLARFATGVHELPSIRDALSLREAYVYAAMLYANFKPEIDAALGADVQALADLDYVKECCK